jgi:two-component system sensor histidine kinase YesM
MVKRILIKAIDMLRNLSIRTKLLLSFFLLIFVPLTLLTAVSYINVARYGESSIRFSANQSYNQAYTLLSYRINTLLNVSQSVCSNADVQDILKRNEDETDIIQQTKDLINLNNFFFGIRNSQDVYRVSLYVPGWMMFADQGVSFNNMNKFRDTAEYTRLINCKDIALWLLPETAIGENTASDTESVISLVRKIKDNNAFSNTIGAVKVSILNSNITDILVRANTTRSGVVFLQNSYGEIICCSDIKALDKIIPHKNIGNLFLNEDYNWSRVSINSHEFIVNTRAINNTDWKLINIISYNEIYSQSNDIKNLMFMLMLALGLIACGLAYIFSTSITKRILLLLTNMSRVQGGDFDVCVTSQSKDEIGKLFDNFNFMIKKIKLLLEEQYAAGKEIKNAELKALQAQINPHFLYNTLELINWKALDNNVPEIVEISQALSKFYRTTLNEGKEIISFETEIEHIKTYVQIQNMRFDNRIILTLDISDEILKLCILKIILQPLVENSIVHGIMVKQDGQEGVIKIAGRIKQGKLFITVRDDGAGMAEEKAKKILAEGTSLMSRGYGVRNINQRIKLCFGQEYGLYYHSSPGKGTLVIIKLPVLEEGTLEL